MSEPKFTNGTWSIWTSHHEIADTGDYYDEIGVKDKNGRQLCVMCGDWDDGVIQANAVLIAQCPRMYKSLKENMNFLRNLAGWLGTTPNMKDSAFVDAMFKQADDIEKLLKKAQGKK